MNEKADGFAVGFVTALLVALVVSITVHIDNGFLFFLATFPTVTGIFWLGLVALNSNIWED